MAPLGYELYKAAASCIAMHQISIQQAESHIAGLLKDVMDGEEFIITDNDKPVAKVSPISQTQEKRGLLGSAKGHIWIADDFNGPVEDFKDYM